tara:strand:- start:51 stop:830 length:780 start_codon:yes stop_codon:yes gene_type:complete
MKRLLLPLLAAIALPKAFTAEVDPKIHELCLPANDYAGCIEFQINKEKKKVDKNKSVINEIEEGKWQYDNYEDIASGKVSYTAQLKSENQINLSFPYAGKQYGRLTIRNHPRFGKDIFLRIEKGQILSISGYSLDDKYFLVRFDDGEVESYRYSESTSGSTDIIFITDEKKFLKNLSNSKKAYITINIYQDGQNTFIFDVKGLKEQFSNKQKELEKLKKQIITRKSAITYCRDSQDISKDTYFEQTYRECMERYGYDPY